MKSLCAICILVMLVCTVMPVSAQGVLFPKLKEKKKDHKDDVVILENGDRLTGEIKKVEFGILYFKSDRAIGTLELDWVRVQRLQSSARYEFETTGGKRYIGLIASDPNVSSGNLVLKLEQGSPLQVKIVDILTIHEMQRNLLGRLNLTLDAGITYTHGSKQTQINVETSLQYSNPKYSWGVDLSSLFNSQSGNTTTSRHDLTFQGTRYLSRRWDYLALGAFLHDNQQNLDLRTTLGGGLQRTFIKSNRTFFTGIGGFVYTRENYIPETDADRNNGEILTGLSLSSYSFRSSELYAYAFVFPSVTDPGRVRVDVSSYWKWEIIKDLYWKFSAWDNFDSRPPLDAPKNNFGVTSSVGWSF